PLTVQAELDQVVLRVGLLPVYGDLPDLPRGADVDLPPGVLAPRAAPPGVPAVVDRVAGPVRTGEATLGAARGGHGALRQVLPWRPIGGARPGPQVGLRAPHEVLDDLLAVLTTVGPHVLHPVRDHPVVGDAVPVVVPVALAGDLPVDRPRAEEGGEGVGHRSLRGVVPRWRRPTEAVHVHAEAIADVVALDDGLLLGTLLDEALRVVAVLGDDATELVDPLGQGLVHPRVARDHARVALGLEVLHRPLRRLDALVVVLDEETPVHHPAEGVLAELGQPPRVAVRALGVDGQDLAGDVL